MNPHYFAIQLTLIVVFLTLLAHQGAPFWLRAMGAVTVFLVGYTLKRTGTALSKTSLGKVCQIGGFGAGTLMLWSAGLNIEAAVGFLCLCLLAKVWEMHTRRDVYVVLNLLLFTQATLFLGNESFVMAAIVAILSFLTLVAFMRLLVAGTKMHIKNLVFYHVAGLPILVLLFLFFPRIDPLWSLDLNQTQGQSGMTDTLSMGDIADLSQSNELAFRVFFDADAPRPSMQYWRGLTLSQYDGLTWSAAPQSPMQSPTLPKGDAFGYKIQLEPSNTRWLFALDYPVSFAGDGILMQSDMTLTHQRNLDTHFAYRVTSTAQEGYQGVPLAQDGDFTPNNPQAMALAQQWNAQVNGDVGAFVGRFAQMIQDGEYYYTLSPGALEGENRIDQFLFYQKRGFCDHYAQSLVYMLRAAGHRARLVVGYQGGQWAPDGQSFEVRARDAHAWTEVYTGGQWVRVDPTAFVAPSRILEGMDGFARSQGQSLFGSGAGAGLSYGRYLFSGLIARYGDQIELYWQQNIVGFDKNTQKTKLFEWFKVTSLSTQIQILIGGSLGVFAGFFGAMRILKRRRYHPLDAPIERLSLALGKRDGDLARLANQGVLDYLEYLGTVLEIPTDKIENLKWVYRKGRFGRDGVEGVDVEAFSRDVATLKKCAKKS